MDFHQRITRRLFLRNTASAGAVAATVATPVVAEAAISSRAEDAAVFHWNALMAALGELTPSGSRLHLRGGHMHTIGHNSATVMALRTVQKELVVGKIVPVEQIAGNYHLSAEGWRIDALY